MTELHNPPFQPDAKQYVPENAYWMARFAALSYMKKPDSTVPDADKILAALQSEGTGFLKVLAFDRDSSQAIAIQHEDYVAAVFCGTDELGDWKDNAKIQSIQGPLGQVHCGFYRALLDVWEKEAMGTCVRELCQRGPDLPERPLWLGGHSLGGSLATLAAAWLAERDLPLQGHYTFGQPSCGYDDFRKALEAKFGDRIFRFVNNNDIVPDLLRPFTSYRHVGRMIYITRAKKLRSRPSEWYHLRDQVLGAVDNILRTFRKRQSRGLDGIADHHIENGYLAGIQHWGARLPEKWKTNAVPAKVAIAPPTGSSDGDSKTPN